MAARPDDDIVTEEMSQGRVKEIAASHEKKTLILKQTLRSHTSRITNPTKKKLTSIMNRLWKKHQKLTILVTGKTGQGKSTLINGLLGIKDAQEGAGATRVTTDVKMYAKTIEGVPIKVFDSPGLQDGTDNEEEYISQMKQECQELSLVLYCTKMTNARLTKDDENAIVKLTTAFGEHFWDYAVLVLTFANREDVSRWDDRDEDNEEDQPVNDNKEAWKALEKKRFEGRLELWKNSFQGFLIEKVGVNPNIAYNIPVVPTGDRKKTHKNTEPLRLPDRDNWFTTFWETCCVRVKETSLFLRINRNRIYGAINTIIDEETSDSSDDESGVETSTARFEDLLQSFKDLDEPRLRSKSESDITNVQAPEVIRRPKRNEAEIGFHIPMEGLLRHPDDLYATLPRRNKTVSMYVSSADAPQLQEPPSKPSPDTTITANIINLEDQNITMDPDFVGEVAAETLRRAGLSERLIRFGKYIVEGMKKPAKWLMKLAHKRNEGT